MLSRPSSSRADARDSFSKENFPKVLKIVDGLQQIGARHGATPGQVALAWLFGQGNVVPVFGASRIQVSAAAPRAALLVR